MSQEFFRSKMEAQNHTSTQRHQAEMAAAAATACKQLQALTAEKDAALRERDAARQRCQDIAGGVQRLLQANMASVQEAAAALLRGDTDVEQLLVDPVPRSAPPSPAPAQHSEPSTRPQASSHGSIENGSAWESQEHGAAGQATSSDAEAAGDSARSATSVFSEEQLGHPFAARSLPVSEAVADPPELARRVRQGETRQSAAASTLDSDPRSWYHRPPRDLAQALAAEDERKALAVEQARRASAQKDAQGVPHRPSPGRGSAAPQLRGATLSAWSPHRPGSVAEGKEHHSPTRASESLALDAGALEAAQAAFRTQGGSSAAVRAAASRHTPHRRMISPPPAERGGARPPAVSAAAALPPRAVAAAAIHTAVRRGVWQGGASGPHPPAKGGAGKRHRFVKNEALQASVSGSRGSQRGGAPHAQEGPGQGERVDATPSLALHSAMTEATRTARKATYAVSRHAHIEQHELMGKPDSALRKPPAPQSTTRAPLVPRCAFVGTSGHAAVKPRYNPAEFQDGR